MQDQYIKETLLELAKLNMSVVYFGNDAVGAANSSQTIFAIGTNRPTFTFSSLCTRDRIGELAQRLTVFPDTELTLETHQNNEVRSISIKSKKGKIKSTFTCMKESVINGREKTLEDVAAGATAAPRERPPKKLNVKEMFDIKSFSKEDLDDIKNVNKTMKCEHINISFEDKLKINMLSERGEKASIEFDQTVDCLTDSKIFGHKYYMNDILMMLQLYPTLSNFYVCSNGVLKFCTPTLDVFVAPIKNVT